MTAEEARVDNAVKVAILTYGAEVLREVRAEVSSLRSDIEGNYRTCATCDARHDGLPHDMATDADVLAVDKRLDELRNWVWGATIAALLAILASVASIIFGR